jgi:hypothetical protein
MEQEWGTEDVSMGIDMLPQHTSQDLRIALDEDVSSQEMLHHNDVWFDLDQTGMYVYVLSSGMAHSGF